MLFSDVVSDSEMTSESTVVGRTRSHSVDSPMDKTEDDMQSSNGISYKGSKLDVPQQRFGHGRVCRKCGHLIAGSQ